MWENCKQLYANKLDNLDEMDKFLETQNLPRLSHKEMENLGRPIPSKESESVITNLPTTTKKPRTRWLYWWSLPNIWGRININPLQILLKYSRGRKISKFNLWDENYPVITARWKHYRKRKPQTNILCGYWCKNSQQNTSKPSKA